MKISKILKISFSAILSLALIASIIVIPAVSAETTVSTDNNLVKNGSFEDGLNNWMSSWAGFSVVKASDAGITAVDGENVMKVDKAAGGSYYNKYNDIAVTANTDYTLSFWIYKSNSDSYISYKVGGNNLTVEDGANSGIKAEQKLDNNTNYPAGKWNKVEVHFNSGVSTSVRVLFVMYKGITYVDAVSLVPTVNYMVNGSFEGGTNGWSRQNTTDWVSVSASSEGLTAVDGTNVVKGNVTVNDWSYLHQTVTLKTNTKYRLSFSYQLLSGGKLFYKAGTSTEQKNYVGETTVTTATTDWKTVTKTFTTSATDNTFKLTLQLRKTATAAVYVDNVLLLEEKTITATAQSGGTVNAATTKAFYGDSVTLTATPNAGYWFDGWYNGDTKVSSLKKYTFTVTDNTALTAKFAEATVDGIIENGSFEANFDNGWSTSYASDFSVVDASNEAPVKAIKGDKILKFNATASGQWHTLVQKKTIEANTDYVFSFWYYRLDDGTSVSEVNYIALQAGYADNNYSGYFQKWLNNEAKGKWMYMSYPFNSGEHTVFNLSLAAYKGIAFVDDVKLVKADDIGNLIENGDMSNAGKALNAWSVGDRSLFTYEAEAEGYTGTGALKIVGNGTDDWKNITYILNVKANTDYKIDFWAKNTSASKKMIYKVMTTSNATLIGGDKYTNGSGENESEWGYNCIAFNTGENTKIKIQFVERDSGTTYIDDIYVGERIKTDVTSSNKALGTVSASKAYVGEDDEVTYTATATAGGKFLGWRVGDSETLVEGETYTYKGFDDITLTAVFEAALGNVNGDSAIDANDMAALRDSILGSADYTALGDMNGNSANDIRDLVALYNAISN